MTSLWSRLGRWRRPLTLLAVGGGATIGYAALAFLGSALTPLPASIVSLLAYAAAGLFSYHAHRALTFSVEGSHGAAPLRFIALGAVGYGVAFGLPLLLTDAMGHPAGLAIGLTCIVAPLLNGWAMARFVFRSSLLEPPMRNPS